MGPRKARVEGPALRGSTRDPYGPENQMIRVSVTSLVLLLIGVSAGTVLLLWFMDAFSRRRREARQNKGVCSCPLCFFEFHNPTKSQLPSCPRCGAPASGK